MCKQQSFELQTGLPGKIYDTMIHSKLGSIEVFCTHHYLAITINDNSEIISFVPWGEVEIDRTSKHLIVFRTIAMMVLITAASICYQM